MSYLTFDGHDPWAIIVRDGSAVESVLLMMQNDKSAQRYEVINPVFTFRYGETVEIVTGWKFSLMDNCVKAWYCCNRYPSENESHWAVPVITLWNSHLFKIDSDDCYWIDNFQIRVITRYHANDCQYCGTPRAADDWNCSYCGAS